MAGLLTYSVSTPSQPKEVSDYNCRIYFPYKYIYKVELTAAGTVADFHGIPY